MRTFDLFPDPDGYHVLVKCEDFSRTFTLDQLFSAIIMAIDKGFVKIDFGVDLCTIAREKFFEVFVARFPLIYRRRIVWAIKQMARELLYLLNNSLITFKGDEASIISEFFYQDNLKSKFIEKIPQKSSVDAILKLIQLSEKFRAIFLLYVIKNTPIRITTFIENYDYYKKVIIIDKEITDNITTDRLEFTYVGSINIFDKAQVYVAKISNYYVYKVIFFFDRYIPTCRNTTEYDFYRRLLGSSTNQQLVSVPSECIFITKKEINMHRITKEIESFILAQRLLKHVKLPDIPKIEEIFWNVRDVI